MSKNLQEKIINLTPTNVLAVPQTHTIDEVYALFKKLRLSAALQALEDNFNLDSFVAMAFIDKLFTLLNAECVKREENGFKRKVKSADLQSNANAITVISRLEQYKISRDLADHLLDGGWVPLHERILIHGPCGTGKTDLAEAILSNLIKKGYNVRAFAFSLLMLELCSLHDSKVIEASVYIEKLKAYSKFDVILLDEFCQGTYIEGMSTVVKEFIDVCNRYKCEIIVTSQKTPAEWLGFLGSDDMAEAAIDRLLSQPRIIELDGDSFRSHKPLTELPENKGDSKKKVGGKRGK